MVMDETDVQGPEQEMVQAIHANWFQELRDVKNEPMHVRELVRVLVCRKRCVETKMEIAARRLDRMEPEQTEVDDTEHEANLQEVLANQSKVVKVGGCRQMVRRQGLWLRKRPERRNRLHPGLRRAGG